MRVVLRDDLDGVGRRGDIVDVAGGFARNFLLPEGRAIVASDGVEAQAATMRRSRDLRDARDKEAATTKAGALAGAKITIPARAGSTGRLFGSVTAADLVEAVRAEKGVELERDQVVLNEPIKEVGTALVTLALFDGVTAELSVEVVPAT
ncbi:MAG TPA: 50S ribosomal protein L9 [Acidimicrobiales bacterium]|nr:50S ribosomal protein L9 [Acidimicrobiales bacterium]